MRRTLPLIVVLVLVGLAAFAVLQWQQNQRLQGNLTNAEQVFLNQKQTLEEHEKTITRLQLDLGRFQDQYNRTEEESKSDRERLSAAEQKINNLAWERDQIQLALTNWVAEANGRGTLLQETKHTLAATQQQLISTETELTAASRQIGALTKQLHASEEKFDSLKTNFSALVVRYNALTAQLNATSAPAVTPVE